MIAKAVVLICFVAGVMGGYPQALRKFQYEMIKDKCEGISGRRISDNEAEQVLDASLSFRSCVTSVVDPQILNSDISEVSEIREVLKGVCSKSTKLKQCFVDLMHDFTACLPSGIEKDIERSLDGFKKLIDQLCYNDAQMITDFISGGGQECVIEKRLSMEQCLEKSKSLSPQETLTMSKTERCRLMDEMSSCMVTELNKCRRPAAADFFRSIFTTLREAECTDTSSNDIEE